MASVQKIGTEAVQIASCHHDDKRSYLDVDFTALRQILCKYSDKLIAIYCISGAQRSGKSFILNIFLQYLENGDQESDEWIETPIDRSFVYNNSARPVTNGIWIWSQPYLLKNSEGRKVAVFLMDSQGWHDSEAPLVDNALLFGLSTLLSSVMIFNVEKKIDEPDLQYLQNFAFNAKWIDSRTIDEPFQKLIVLIRDWIFTTDYPCGFYDGNAIEGKDFVKNTLRPESVKSADGQKLRELIQSAYEQTSACLLPHPGDIVTSNTFDVRLMHPNFRKTVVEFTTKLFDPRKLVPKRLAGKLLTATELFAEAVKWNDSFNRNTSATTFSYLSANETEFQIAYQSALDYFDNKIMKALTTDSDQEEVRTLLDSLNSLIQECQKGFDSNAKLEQLDRKLKRKTSRKLKEELSRKSQLYRTALQNKLDRIITEVKTQELQGQISELQQKAVNNSEMKELFEQQIKMFEQMIKDNHERQEEMAKRHEEEMRQLREELQNRNDSSWLNTLIESITEIVVATVPAILSRKK